MPADKPVITPDEPTFAKAFVPDHVPPIVALLSEVVKPEQTLAVPRMLDNGFTVIVVVVLHPLPRVYVMFAVPADIPVTIPFEEPMIATPVLPLVHEPPVVRSDKLVISPTQTGGVPVMPGNASITVTVVVTVHPVGVR